VKKLVSIRSSTDREGYILMDRLSPPGQMTLLLDSKSRRIEKAEVTCELGIYGTYVRY